MLAGVLRRVVENLVVEHGIGRSAQPVVGVRLGALHAGSACLCAVVVLAERAHDAGLFRGERERHLGLVVGIDPEPANYLSVV